MLLRTLLRTHSFFLWIQESAPFFTTPHPPHITWYKGCVCMSECPAWDIRCRPKGVVLTSPHFRHFTSCPCGFPAFVIAYPALISSTCPSLVTHLCVFSLCVPLSLCQFVFVPCVKHSSILPSVCQSYLPHLCLLPIVFVCLVLDCLSVYQTWLQSRLFWFQFCFDVVHLSPVVLWYQCYIKYILKTQQPHHSTLL